MYRKILIGGATAAVILGSGTAALALSGSSTTNGTPSPSSTSSSSAAGSGSSASGKAGKTGKAGKKGRGALLRRAEHGELVLHTKKGAVTVQFVKGTVTSVSSSAISVQSMDKKTESFTVNKDTIVKSRTKPAKGATPAKPTDSSISKVSKGDHVVVFGKGAGTATAGHIIDIAG